MLAPRGSLLGIRCVGYLCCLVTLASYTVAGMTVAAVHALGSDLQQLRQALSHHSTSTKHPADAQHGLLPDSGAAEMQHAFVVCTDC